MPTSESEVHEWGLVSPDLAAKLRAERCPVLQFCELNMWGREATGTALEDVAAAKLVYERALSAGAGMRVSFGALDDAPNELLRGIT